MSTMNVLSITLIALILATCLALFFGVRAAQAGVLQTPAGGFGVIDAPAPAPRPDGFTSTAGGDPNV
ncbi:hypothetical protein KUL25_20275 [Rhodobacteraceae bacterium N5(2021)]|uniref:Uncharacterized protein n=1 Tax=Gymnodinialimonas phycosphaerae TaxID=2841589 RepID=A0A975TU66_9RHOB|nr:hypothetical protein [Gymnodinialimonas phycosphaerae]MBY4895104.1 hypothetical protein [Gymnodinialimonas phycosphaerae]